MRLLTIALATTLLATGAHAQQPILVGGDPDFDACGMQGAISGLKAGNEKSLPVYDAPEAGAVVLDRLELGFSVNVCDETDDWWGVVYGDDCGVGTPILERRPYDGPCEAGWIEKRFLTPTAG